MQQDFTAVVTDDRSTGVMLITVWSDEPGDDGLRARLRATGDVTRGATLESSVAGRIAIVQAVANWLDDLAASP